MAIVDHDTVDISNLQRQILHTEARVGMSKARSAELAIKECVTLASLLFSNWCLLLPKDQL